MACACQRNTAKTAVGSTLKEIELPHEIRPGVSCIFCAEKHVAIAYTYLASAGLCGIIRQHILGELELARRHTINEYQTEADKLKAAIIAVMLRDNAAPSLIQGAALSVQKTTAELKDGKDDTANSVYTLPNPVGIKISPFFGELHFCAAWELITEVGYYNVNRSMLIGDLALAQKHFDGYDGPICNSLTDLRHIIQRGEQSTIQDAWFKIAQQCESLITGNLQYLKERNDVSVFNAWSIGKE